MYLYRYMREDVLLEKIKHGLSIEQYLSISISVNGNKTADVLINAPTGMFSRNVEWDAGVGTVQVINGNSTLKDACLSFYSEDYKRDVWMFGDSYFSHYPVYLFNWGYNNMLLDGYGGRGAERALQSLNKCLEKCIPEKIVWCMGMNDADTKESINLSWKTTIENVIQLCEHYDIELILTTIPNVPGRNHSFKNSYIRASGLRYIDISQAVGAEISQNWFKGLLSGDEVHATELGKRLIASKISDELPEIYGN